MAEPQREPAGSHTQLGTGTVPRIVLDTDCLVAAAYAEGSASRRVLEMCLSGEVVALVNPDLQQEYEYIISRAVRGRDFGETLQQFLAKAEQVQPSETARVVPDGADDDKLVAAALAGRADALVINYRHLLRAGTGAGGEALHPRTTFGRIANNLAAIAPNTVTETVSVCRTRTKGP